MKLKRLIYISSIVLAGLFTMQSCTKDENPEIKTYKAAMPANPTPGNEGIVAFAGNPVNIDLKWDGSASSSIKWDVYFGDTEKPAKVATGVSGNTYTVNVTSGGTYYWQVITVDANGIKSTSPVWSLQVNSNPGVPTVSAPALNATGVSCTPTLKWAATDPEEDDLTYDVYLGKTNNPGIAYGGLTDAQVAITTSLSESTDYYWKVVAKDPYGGVSESPVWKFTTGLEPINTFVGNYTADEPAEAYSYDVSFTKVSSTAIKTTNYWNSGWAATFNVDLTKLTYTLPLTTFQSGWTGTESGIVDPATGTMTGTYTIWHNGAIAEQGVHTYTKK